MDYRMLHFTSRSQKVSYPVSQKGKKKRRRRKEDKTEEKRKGKKQTLEQKPQKVGQEGTVYWVKCYK